MLALFFLLLVLWGVGVLAAFTLGGLIHILLFLAVVSIAVHFLRGRRRPA